MHIEYSTSYIHLCRSPSVSPHCHQHEQHNLWAGLFVSTTAEALQSVLTCQQCEQCYIEAELFVCPPAKALSWAPVLACLWDRHQSAQRSRGASVGCSLLEYWPSQRPPYRLLHHIPSPPYGIIHYTHTYNTLLCTQCYWGLVKYNGDHTRFK